MIETAFEAFCRAPAGRYTITGSSFVWCHSPAFGGAVMWGTQSDDETRRILEVFDRTIPLMARRFDLVLDTRGVQHVEPSGVKILFAWLVENHAALAERIGLQASVIRESPIGFLLTGLLPVVGRTHAYRLFTDPAAAFQAVAGGENAALCAEVEAILDRIRGVPRELLGLRELLAERVDVTVEEASRKLGTSPRSLQRIVSAYGTSFHQEVVAARLALAQQLLRGSDAKLAVVAARVGISERALALLFKEKIGATPAEWRRAHKAQ